MITKNDLVLDAYEEMRVSGITVSPDSGEVVSAVKRMDSMVLGWQNKGICLSYVRSTGYSDIDPNQDSGINDVNALAVVLNLAKALCPMFGKQADRETRVNAKTAYEGLFSPELTMRDPTPYQPTGAGESFFFGNRISGYCFNYFQTLDESAPDYCTTKDIITGQIEFYGVDFSAYLNEVDGDLIFSFTVEDGEGVKILDSFQSGQYINLEAQGGKVGFSQVLVTITTTSGRVLPENVNFNVIAT